jgi:hypothetical protein
MDAVKEDELGEILSSEDDEERQRLEALIKSSFISSGGAIPLNKDSMLPISLEELSEKDLVNICDNIALFDNRNQKQMMTSRALESVSNILATFAHLFGVKSITSGIEAFNTDKILREAVVKCMVGKGINPPPPIALVIALSSHVTYFLSEFTKTYVEQHSIERGKSNGKKEGDSTSDSTRKSGNSEDNASMSNTGDGKVAVREDNSSS